MKVLMTHLYFGDPSEEFSLKLAETLLESGADILEVGIPYTDPVCDGEVFQRACKRALENGITPPKVFTGIKKIRDKGYKNKIYLTSYYAPIFKIGVKKFVSLAKDAQVTGLIVPDILLEEEGELQKYCQKFKLALIQFVTVYSSKDRLRQIVRESSDFIYCVSLPGVTGDQTCEKNKLLKLIRLLKSMTKKPIYVGFGIKSAEDAGKVIEMGADGVIVGSAIARIYEKTILKPEESLPEISDFIKSLKGGKMSL